MNVAKNISSALSSHVLIAAFAMFARKRQSRLYTAASYRDCQLLDAAGIGVGFRAGDAHYAMLLTPRGTRLLRAYRNMGEERNKNNEDKNSVTESN